ncbi:hypothetical protein [Burkholderia seminalis]|uniref:hypothetical protein n=1 Tax=Burkholderia seminalis TaxID=488731 RepID=UPI001CF4BB32|nr:hypothetical protein [Burkholderia seminalis]MCA8041838.1 hypothetical protein [Burkholderia seminalis]
MSTSRKMPGNEVLSVSTVYRRYSRQYNSTVRFGDLPSGPLPDCWVRDLLERLAVQSVARPFGHTEIKLFKRGLDHAFAIESALPTLFAAAESITRHDICRLFELIDQAEPRPFYASEKHRERASAAFRQRVLDYGAEGKFDGTVSRETVAFRARSTPSRPRPIVSDLIGLVGDPLARAPVDAISHSTIKELERRARDRIDFDLKKIIDACIDDMIFWRKIRSDLNGILNDSAPETDIVSRAFEASATRGKSISNWTREVLLGLPSGDLIGGYLKRVKMNRLAHLDVAGTYSFTGAIPALRSALGVCERFKENQAYKILFLPERMHPEELISAFVLLQIYTAWNMHSLVGLTSDRIFRNDEGYEIQGFKSKTDDDAPPVFIDKSQRFGIDALDLLLWNLRNLKNLGRVAEDQTGMWFCYSSEESKRYDKQYVGFQKAIRDFCDRHGFPHFSFDQIRAQVLLAGALLVKNPEESRRIAGHKTISVTGGYLDQEFARRLNTANNLEFQRRFDNTVKFRISKDRGYEWLEHDSTLVDPDLLMPVGDGTLCANPNEPPHAEYFYGDMCDGRRCHIGEGCINRRIELDELRLEELVRKRRYYTESWQRLARENPDAFNAFHGPSMLFNMALYAFVKEGPYGHVLAYIERTMK